MILRGNVYSETLGMHTGVTVVTPTALRGDDPLKVAWLLHGLCGDHATWTDCSMLPVYAAGGKTVYIMPNADRSYYTDMRYGGHYFTWLTEELPVLCRRVFNISAERENTAVIGASMGGYGALKCALSKPEQYGMCAAFSSACLFLKEGLDKWKDSAHRQQMTEMYGKEIARDFVATFGENYQWEPEHEILHLARSAAGSGVSVYTACGTGDFFYGDHCRFTREMEMLNLNFTHEEWEGVHDFTFFDKALKKATEHFGL